jgi:cytoskeletal protein CcmA (bactofilin family)
MAAISMKTKSRKQAESSLNGKSSALKGSDANCVISTGTHIEGDFSSAENVRLDGSLKGTFKCDKRLVIGEKGKIEGQVAASEAVILGMIVGNIVVDGTLHLKSSAKINGDISTKYLIVDEGAAYNGQCKVGS